MSQNKIDREVAAFFERFERDVIPKIEGSAFSVVCCFGKPDAKLCLEVGASILLEKPLIIADPAAPVPLRLRNIASAVIVGKMGDPSFEERIAAAVREVLKQRPPA